LTVPNLVCGLKEIEMTCCVRVVLNEGMIFALDSRTNAGVDNFSKYCKMTVFERLTDRVIVLLSSGSLAGTQALISVLRQRGDAADDVPSQWSEGVREVFVRLPALTWRRSP
jgi:putative proteasome-type protease